MKVIDHATDPVFVEDSHPDKISLRIGEPKPGETRYALLSTGQARIVAYALLGAAERVELDQERRTAPARAAYFDGLKARLKALEEKVGLKTN